jgi:hypothetical protein
MMCEKLCLHVQTQIISKAENFPCYVWRITQPFIFFQGKNRHAHCRLLLQPSNVLEMKLITADLLYILILVFLGIPFFAEFMHWQPVVIYSLMAVGIILMLVRIFRGDD